MLPDVPNESQAIIEAPSSPVSVADALRDFTNKVRAVEDSPIMRKRKRFNLDNTLAFLKNAKINDNVTINLHD